MRFSELLPSWLFVKEKARACGRLIMVDVKVAVPEVSGSNPDGRTTKYTPTKSSQTTLTPNTDNNFGDKKLTGYSSCVIIYFLQKIHFLKTSTAKFLPSWHMQKPP